MHFLKIYKTQLFFYLIWFKDRYKVEEHILPLR